MSKTIDIRITTAADLKGVQAAQKALADLAKSSSKSSGGSTAGAANAYNAQAKAANTAAQAAAKLAIADSRVAAAASNAATAAQRNAAAVSNAAAASSRAEKAALSLAMANQRAAASATSTGTYFTKMGDAVSSSLMGIVGPAAVVTTALAGMKAGFDLSQASAKIDATRESFNSLAVSVGTTGSALLTGLRAAAQGTVSDANLIASANSGILLTGGKLASELPRLLEIARASAKATGEDIGFVFDSLVKGIARGSPQIIDNAKITLDAEGAFKAYAASIGKSSDELTRAEQQQATLNAVMAAGADIIAKTGGATENNANAFARAGATIENTKNALGSMIADGLRPYADSIGQMGERTQQLTDWIGQIGTVTPEAAAATAAYAAEMEKSGSVTLANAAYDAALAAAKQQVTAVTTTATAATVQETAASVAYAIQARAAAMATEQKSIADQVAAIDAQTHGIAEEKLAQQAQAAAAAMLASGVQGANAAAMLANSSSRVDVLTAAYYRLAAAQAAAAQAKTNAAAFSDQRAGERDAGSARTAAQITFAADQDRKAHASRIRRAEEAEAALKRLGTAGGAARVSAAGAAATKLETLEQKTGDKIAEIVASTQEKVTAITQREAAKQAQALQKLNESLATAAADRRASSESDDLDLIGVDDPKAAARLNDRERAQAAAREREKQAAAEARATAEAGDAELAQKQFDIREKQIGDQQALDEKYYDKQRELASDPATQDALKTQYDEATRANEEAAQTRIGLAQAEAAQKKQAVADETAAVIAAANEQANQVVSAAERSATGVKNASASARTTAVSNLKAIGDAVNAIPSSKTITISVKQDGSVGASSAPAGRAKGGDTNVGRVTLVGEKGPELVVFDTPGRVYSADKTKAMFQAGRIPGLASGGTIDAGGGYTTPIAGSTPTSGGKGKKKKGYGKISTAAPIDPKKALDEMRNTVQLLMDMAKLKEQIADLVNVPAFDIPTVQALVNRAQEFTAYVNTHLVPITKKEVEGLDFYFKAAHGATSVISDMASLKKDIAELKDVPAFDQPMVLALIDRAQQFTTALQQHLIPLTEFEAEQFSRYASAVGDSVSILKDMADLKKELAEPAPPIDTRYINQLVADAAVVTVIMRQHLIATTEEQAKQVSLYADAVGSTASALKDVASIGGKLFADYTSPTEAQLRLLTTDADRITGAFATAAAAYKKDGLEQAKLYADAVGATFGTVKDGLLAVEALNSGDFVLKPGVLEKFATASMDILDTTERLGARASQIPAGDMAALQTATAAIAGQAEAWIKLAAVPWGDLSGAAAGYAQSGGAMGGMGGGGNTTIMPGAIVVNAQPGMDVRAIGQEVMRQINQQVRTHR
jgi:hypothetical protein